MSRMVPKYRKEAIEALGANVEIYGSNSDEADLHAREISKKENIPLIHPFDDEDVIAGQGTVGLEILRQSKEVPDAIYVAVGGGGLIGGIAAVEPTQIAILLASRFCPETSNPPSALKLAEPRKTSTPAAL